MGMKYENVCLPSHTYLGGEGNAGEGSIDIQVRLVPVGVQTATALALLQLPQLVKDHLLLGPGMLQLPQRLLLLNLCIVQLLGQGSGLILALVQGCMGLIKNVNAGHW